VNSDQAPQGIWRNGDESETRFMCIDDSSSPWPWLIVLLFVTRSTVWTVWRYRNLRTKCYGTVFRRITDSKVDIGADEFHPHVYRDRQAIVPGGEIRIMVIGYPGTEPVTLGIGSGYLEKPQTTPYGLLYPIPPISTYNIGTIPSNGFLIYNTSTPGSWSPGDEFPIQVLWGPIGGPDSMVSNLLLLTVGGSTLYVPDNYGTIQGAIDAALAGDTIVVRPGTYNENINLLGKSIRLKSEFGPKRTVIKAAGEPSVVTFKNSEGRDTVLQGFTITGGDFEEGGGILCYTSSPTITNNIIIENSTSLHYKASKGGGIFCICHSEPLISNNVIKYNKCQGSHYAQVRGYGAGIYLDAQSDAVIVNNIIVKNKAGMGGSPYVWGHGGGICCFNSEPIVTNNTIADNYSRDGASSGIHSEGSGGPIVTNCIVRNKLYGPMTVNFCNLEQSFPGGLGNQYDTPNFVSRQELDSHLKCGSPCRNAGDVYAPGLPDTDFEGDARLSDGMVDIGADEIAPRLYVWTIKNLSLKVIGQPDMSPVTLIQGSGVREEPLPTLYGDLYLLPPAVHTIDLGVVPSDGVLITPISGFSHLQPGEMYPFQVLIGDRNNPDAVLTNLLEVWYEGQ